MSNIKVSYTFGPLPTYSPVSAAAAPPSSVAKIIQGTCNGLLYGGVAGAAVTAIVALTAAWVNPNDAALAALIFGGIVGTYAIPGGAAGGAVVGGIRAALS